MAAPHSVQEVPCPVPAADAPASDSPWQRHKPFWAGLVLLTVLCGWLYALCLQNTGGRFVYPLDDTYIHLAMARTLAQHGVWGMNGPDGFASAASSLAWPVQLAGLTLVFGPQEWLALALNIVWGVVALAAAYWMLASSGVSRRLTFWGLAAVIFFTSLPVLVLMGMEHTMQTAVNLLFAGIAAGMLGSEKKSWKRTICLGALALLVTATRYEGMFLVLAVALAALLVRHWRDAGIVVLMAAAPIVGFGLFSLAQGALFLPNPIAVKSDFYGITSVWAFLQLMFGPKLAVFLGTPAVLVPVLLALLGLVLDAGGKNRLTTRDRLFIPIVVLTCGMHLFGARTGWFTRYEAYLVFMAILAAIVAWRPLLQDARLHFGTGDGARPALLGMGVVVLALVLAAPFAQRMSDGLFSLPAASKNIHDQQIQMARFVKEHYDGQPILINDLGAISFFSDARPVDMAGLATLEVARAMIKPTANWPGFLDKLARDKGARIAIIYTNWLPNRVVPNGWIKVGSWTIQHNVICGGDVVDFYALDYEAAKTLEFNLRSFEKSLPKDVIQSGTYME